MGLHKYKIDLKLYLVFIILGSFSKIINGGKFILITNINKSL